MSTFHVHLFGKFCFQRDEQVLAGLDARRVQELFCYLLLYRDHPHPRETLASLLWGDYSTAQSKKCLRQVLWQLQTILDSHPESGNSRVLLIEPDWVQINPEADLWLDVAVFDRAFALVQELPGHELDAQSVQTLKSTVQLYQGDLLEGWYHDWCLYERERLQNMYLAMLDKLMEYCEAHCEYETGLVYGPRILRYDRASERTHRRLMRLHYLSGDRTAALRQYERCVAALSEELGVGPDKHTAALYDQIREDQLDSPATVTVTLSPEVAASPLPEVLSHLKQLLAALTNIEHRVKQDIQAIEFALKRRR